MSSSGRWGGERNTTEHERGYNSSPPTRHQNNNPVKEIDTELEKRMAEGTRLKEEGKVMNFIRNGS